MKKALFSTAALFCLCVLFPTTQAQNFDDNPPDASQKINSKTSAPEVKKQEQIANHSSNAAQPANKPGAVASDAPAKTSEGVVVPVVSSTATEPAVNKAETKVETAAISTATLPPTSLYRVGAGDVLDIKLLNNTVRESTLYTVMADGLLEYPLAGEALSVAGLTIEEIAERLTAKVTIYDKPQVSVSVREYASHSVIITGLTHEPGTRALRREAVPLFVVLAEAQPRADAARAIIMRSGTPSQTINLSDTTATNVLIYPNDVIRLVAAPPLAPQFFYIGGQIVSTGQKDFHQGITLTQAIFASGGVTRFAGSKAKVMRQGADGRLATTEYNLKKIEQGKDPDPQLEAGDRIEITRGGW